MGELLSAPGPHGELREHGDASVRALHAAGDLAGAATMALRIHGADVVRFIRSRLRSSVDREEAFSLFCEDLWRGLPGFEWRCTLRTWLFTLARNAGARLLAAAHRRREVYSPALELDTLASYDDDLHPSYALHLRPDVQQRMRELRQALSRNQQTLLALRVDQMLSWRQLAITLRDVPEGADDLALQRAEARLRVRFGVIKRRLRTLAELDGLTASEGD